MLALSILYSSCQLGKNNILIYENQFIFAVIKHKVKISSILNTKAVKIPHIMFKR